MGTLSPFRVILLSALLAATAFLVHGGMISGSGARSKPPLRQIFERIDNWNGGSDQQLGVQIASWLKLDDYLYRSFARDRQAVTLYVGYYRTAAKVGAAHDPLVCFQGQGWVIVERSKGHHALARAPGLGVSYSSMIAERQGERQLILYWFQTNGRSSAGTLSQKVDMVKDRLFGRGEENAFVRISTPIDDGSPDAAHRRILDFVEDFYPAFHGYMVKK